MQIGIDTLTQIEVVLLALLYETDHYACEIESTIEEGKMRGWANSFFVICPSTFA